MDPMGCEAEQEAVAAAFHIFCPPGDGGLGPDSLSSQRYDLCFKRCHLALDTNRGAWLVQPKLGASRKD